MSSFNQTVRDALLTYLLEEHDIVAVPNDLNSLIMQAAGAYLEDPPVNRHPGYVSGRYYSGYPAATVTTSALPAVDTIYFCPVIITTPLSFDRIKVNVMTGVASSLLKHGLWACDPATNKPIGAPIVADNTGLDCSTSSTFPEIALSGELEPGLYWWGGKSGHTPTFQALSSAGGIMSWDIGRSTGNSVAHMCGLQMAHAMATDLPTLTGAETITDYATNGIPMPWFRST